MVNIYKLYFYVLAIKKKLEIDIFKALFTIVPQNMKCLGTNPTKCVQVPYEEKYRTQVNKIKEFKSADTPCL